MQYKKIGENYLLKIESDEEIIGTLVRFCVENNISSGFINGIGGTDDVSLKYYDLTKKQYITKNFKGKNYEILSLNGNISLVSGKTFLHMHAVLGDSDYHAFGGHLESAVVGITCEVTISMMGSAVNRKFDEEFKLNFLDL